MVPSNAGKFQRLFFAIILAAVLASAQSLRGSISGTVTDATGAVVPQAHVALKSAGTGLSRSRGPSQHPEVRWADLHCLPREWKPPHLVES